MQMSDMIPNQQNLKSFWQKPEGKIGMIISALLLGAGAIGFFKILPMLILLATNTLTLILLLAAIGIIVFPLTQSDFRLKLKVGYQIILKKLAGCIIKTDPIAILKITIQKGKDRLEEFEEQIRKLKAVMANVSRKIKDYKSNAENSMLMAQQAQKQNIKSQIYLNTNQAARMKDAAIELSGVYTRLDTLYKVLGKMYENANVVLKDTEQAVALQEDKWIAIRQSFSAMQSAMKALKGDKDDRALFEETMEYVNNDLGMKMGEIEYMLDASEQIMDNIDVNNGMFHEKGMKMLEDFEKKADSWLLNNSSSLPNAINNLNTNVQSGQIQSQNAERPNQFSNLFSSNN